jgi:putative glutamine amidotransferase
MKMKPKIFLSGVQNSTNYIAAIEAGGASVEVGVLSARPLSPERYAEFDGVIFSGGGDVDPRHYGEAIAGSHGIDPMRDENELALARGFMRTGKPILGICRGHQLFNIALGGSLIQHIDTAEGHAAPGDAVHAVRAEKGSLLHTLYGERFFVNSSHHQAIGRSGEGVWVNCQAEEDGLAEAFSHRSLPVFGVQFHPERMCCAHSRTDTVDGLAIFRWFVRQCEK